MNLSEKINEGAENITCSLVCLGSWQTQDELHNLDWLKTTSAFGLSYYLEEAERRGWIRCRHRKGTESALEWTATAKGKRFNDSR